MQISLLLPLKINALQMINKRKKCILKGNMQLESVAMFLFLLSPKFDLERKAPEVAACLLLGWLKRTAEEGI